jgi:hypothetical protein
MVRVSEEVKNSKSKVCAENIQKVVSSSSSYCSSLSSFLSSSSFYIPYVSLNVERRDKSQSLAFLLTSSSVKLSIDPSIPQINCFLDRPDSRRCDRYCDLFFKSLNTNVIKK